MKQSGARTPTRRGLETASARLCGAKRARLLRCAVELRGDFHRREMDVHRIENVPRIATRHRDHDKHAGAATEFQNQAISRSEALPGQREPPQTIIAIGIRTGKIDREFGLRSRKRVADALFQCIKIVGVAGAVRQLDVEIAAFCAKRKIAGAVNRKK